MSFLEETKRLLREYKISPKRCLGQNFLIDGSVFPRLASCASLTFDDVVLDAGAGFGFLTRFLAERCRLVLAVENDSSVACALEERLGEATNVSILKGDVLTADLPPFNKVVSAPPYQISSAFLMWLFDHKFNCAVLVLQKDFASRLVAKVGSEDYSWLTVYSYFKGDIKLLDSVSRAMFYPEPGVDSIIVRVVPHSKSSFTVNSEMFVKMIKSIFSERNKKLVNAVMPFATGVLKLSPEEARLRLITLSFCYERPRELAPEAFGEVANVLIN